MARDGRVRQLDGTRVAVGVIGMAVRVDYVRHVQPLLRRARDEHVRRERRINQNCAPGRAISEKVSKVPIASGANLLEDKLHTIDCKVEALFLVLGPRSSVLSWVLVRASRSCAAVD